MRGWLKASLAFTLLFLALQGIVPQEPLLGDLLTEAWQAELENEIGKASSAYARAINLQPENPLLRIKYAEMLILLDRFFDETARQLVQALELLSKDPKAPVDLKRFVCDLLMGRLPEELRRRRMQLGYDYEGWLYPPPFVTLPVETQKQVLQLVPKDWLFPTKANEAWFRLSVGEREQGFKLLREAVMEGDVITAVRILMSRFVTKEQRTQIAQSWLGDAERTDNPFVWLAALHMLWRTQQIDEFKSGFSKAMQAMKDQPALLFELANLCKQMKWEEGYRQVLALLPPSLKPSVTIASIREDFRRALDEGDLTKVKALIRVLVDFPEQFRIIVLDANSIRRMLGHGWHDFVIELIQLDLVPELPYDTKQVLLRDAAFNPTRFSHWMRLFMSKPIGTPHETAVNLLETTAGPEPERAIWLLEQGLLVFPDEPRLLTPLALAYERAGYPNRAIAILKELVKRNAKAGVIHSNLLSRLWDIAFQHQQLPQLVEWLKEQRKDFPLGYFVEVARLWMQLNKPQEALEWLNEAFAIAKERGWFKDAEVHAMIYYLLRSPNPEDFEQAQKLRERVTRTNMLFHPDTYELRLDCLVRLGKKDEAKQVLDEATRLYPNYPFIRRVRGLAQIVVTDWGTELQHAKERWQRIAAPNYDALLRLAYATFKAGQASEVKLIADELMLGQPHWREGYLLAVKMFEHRIDALLPFVRWILNNAPKDQLPKWRTVESIGETILSIGEPSLYGAFMIASVSLSKTEDIRFEFELQDLIGRSVRKWWMSITPEDREALRAVLAKEQINPHALSLMSIHAHSLGPRDQETLTDWLKRLQEKQTWSAHVLIHQIYNQLQGGTSPITRDQIRQWLKALENADWSDADWYLLGIGYHLPLPKMVAQYGFKEEAVTLLKIAIKHAPEEHKAKLLAQLTELTGKLPELPKGDEAKDGKLWLTQAEALLKAQRNEEAKKAAVKALELGLPLNEQAEALRILSFVDPELALRFAVKRFSNFLVAEEHSDSPLHLFKIVDTLFGIAERRKEFAHQIAPLIEKAANFSPTMKTNTFKQLALVHFWAGNTSRGILALFEPLDKGNPQWNLRSVMEVMLHPDVPEDARRQIAKHLSSYLQNRQVSLSVIADELEGVTRLNVAPDGSLELAQILRQCLERAEGVIPRKFLEQVLWKVKNFAAVTKPFSQERLLPDEVIDAWWNLFEDAFRKAVKTVGDEKSLKQWLRQFWIERPDTAFSKTVWFERLKKLAE